MTISTDTPTLVMENPMAEVRWRNMLLQVLIFICTFGIYGIYWFHQTATELKSIARDEKVSPTIWTVLFFIPLGAFYSMFKYAELFERISKERLNRWILFLLYLVFPAAVWFIVQMDLNSRVAKR